MSVDKEKLRKQLKMVSSAIDLIKMSQRAQHTSIKEALRKMVRAISIMAEIELEKKKEDSPAMKRAKEIAAKKKEINNE